MSLAGTAVALLLLASLPLFPLSLALGSWQLFFASAAPLAGFFWVWGPLLVPRKKTNAGTAAEIRLLTYNTHGHKRDLQPLGMMLRGQNADIIAVQELSDEAADYFGSSMSEDYPYQYLHPSNKRVIGLGLLSRYPILEESYHSGVDGETPTGRQQRAVLDVSDQRVTLYNVHAPALVDSKRFIGFGPHKRVVKNLIERSQLESGPLLLAGDFNMTRHFREYRRISGLYRDAFRDAGRSGFGFTYPSGLRLPFLRVVVPPPFVGLDFVFHNGWFEAVDARIVSAHRYSDHLPLLAVLSLSAEPILRNENWP